ncbi:GNAT family N-acetyltransferase [Rubrobacter tropicus]|uniref:GNAT family N-acetyltransferase n=1 Tax=Rubrobacter tropicus TaxID=2653851 RepID=UPI001A9D64A9|nr:GNAT family N-acetyltransferase [Rubrobacter tropicus]
MREARPGDLGRLLELYALLERPEGHLAPLASGAAEDLFTRVLLDPNQRTLVAETYGEVVGTLVLVTVPNLAHGGSPYALVENVVVDEEYRGEGVGRALMREAVRRAREAGAYKLALCSNTGRSEAHEFYRSMGFEETHVGFEVRP